MIFEKHYLLPSGRTQRATFSRFLSPREATFTTATFSRFSNVPKELEKPHATHPKIKGCLNAALALTNCNNLHIRDEFVFDVHAYDAGVIDFAVLGEEDLERVAVAHLEKVERAVAVDRRGVACDHASCATYNCA